MSKLKVFDERIKELQEGLLIAENNVTEEIISIDKEKSKVIDNFKKRIEKEFKNVEVFVRVSDYGLDVDINGAWVLHYSSNRCEFRNISRVLKDKIISDYEDTYGEIKFEPQTPYVGFISYTNAFSILKQR